MCLSHNLYAYLMLKNILIIEDDDDILDALKALLEFNDYEVKGISKTDDAIESVKMHNPDLVLTDYILPGMNGGKICQTIKKNKNTSHIPVILMSAYHQQAISIGNFGFDAYLPKPFDNQKLIKIIQGLLK